MFETSFLNDFHKNTGKEPLIWVHFIDEIYFIEIICNSETKNMKSVITFEISQSTKLINFLYTYIILNHQITPTNVFLESTEAHIYLNKFFITLNIHDQKHPKVTIPTSHQMITLQKLWKMLFISSKKLFWFSRYSSFYNFFHSFSHFPDLKGQMKME